MIVSSVGGRLGWQSRARLGTGASWYSYALLERCVSTVGLGSRGSREAANAQELEVTGAIIDTFICCSRGLKAYLAHTYSWV